MHWTGREPELLTPDPETADDLDPWLAFPILAGVILGVLVALILALWRMQ